MRRLDGTEPPKEHKGPNVADKIGADHHFGSPDADSTGEELHAGLLIGKHMLSARVDFGLS